MAGVTGLDGLARRVQQGTRLSVDDAAQVLQYDDLIAVGMLGDEARVRRHGPATTFVRVFEVHTDAVPKALPGRVEAGELRLVGDPVSLDAAAAAVAALRSAAAGVPLFGYALHTLVALGDPAHVFRTLREAGLDGIAEMAIDRGPLPEHVTAARSAGLRVLRAVVHERSEQPLEMLQRARTAFATVGGVRAFAPLPRQASAASPTTGYDDVKLIAASRLFLDDVPSIQVDWPLYGPKLAQVALLAGADDVDGVSAVDTGLGARRSPLEEIRRNIAAAGLQPVERNGWFEALPARQGAGA